MLNVVLSSPETNKNDEIFCIYAVIHNIHQLRSRTLHGGNIRNHRIRGPNGTRHSGQDYIDRQRANSFEILNENIHKLIVTYAVTGARKKPPIFCHIAVFHSDVFTFYTVNLRPPDKKHFGCAKHPHPPP
jgi:hypothetical protein